MKKQFYLNRLQSDPNFEVEQSTYLMMCKKLFNNPHYNFRDEKTITYALKKQIENKSLSKMMDENTEKELRTHGL